VHEIFINVEDGEPPAFVLVMPFNHHLNRDGGHEGFQTAEDELVVSPFQPKRAGFSSDIYGVLRKNVQRVVCDRLELCMSCLLEMEMCQCVCMCLNVLV